MSDKPHPLLESAARAACKAGCEPYEEADCSKCRHWREELSVARAVIEAICEPTDDVFWAGEAARESQDREGSAGTITAVYQSMLGRILGEG